MAVDFTKLLLNWEDIGLFNVVLPFLLVFTIVYASIIKTSIFGTESKRIGSVIALIAGLLVVRNQYIVAKINQFLPNIALILIVILMFLLLVGTFAGQGIKFSKGLLTAGFFISLIFVIWAFYAEKVGTFEGGFRRIWYSIDEQTKALLIFAAIVLGIIWLVTGSGGSQGNIFKKIVKGIESGLGKDGLGDSGS